MKELIASVTENLVFVLEFLGIIVALFLAALLVERIAQKKRGVKEKIFTTRKMTMIGMFSAIATVLHLLDFALFFAPGFYKLDFSEIPILIGAFAFGPAAGVMMEFLKILLKLCVAGTSTAFVGDLANFIVGCSFILPASIIYSFCKNKKGAITGCVVGTLVLVVFGTAFNAIYLLPKFSTFIMPMDKIIAAGEAVNPLVKGDIISFVIACVAPLNILKGGCASIFTMLVYKRISPIIKEGNKR
ncbi:MAG: ECF transporter S component [Lachnospiraceae bacterium]|nr:ECF transporter S component [Lachnospiraceae bacterium]